MRKYETLFRIVNVGEDEFDAGERAGNIVDISMLENGSAVSCEPTHLKSPIEDIRMEGVVIDKVLRKYETVISVVNEGTDDLDAGERAGEIFDVSRMQPDMIINCDGTCLIYDETEKKMGGLIYSRNKDDSGEKMFACAA